MCVHACCVVLLCVLQMAIRHSVALVLCWLVRQQAMHLSTRLVTQNNENVCTSAHAHPLGLLDDDSVVTLHGWLAGAPSTETGALCTRVHTAN